MIQSDDELPQSRQPYVPPPAPDGTWIAEDKWMSYHEAGSALRISRPRVLARVHNGHLKGAVRQNGDQVVTRESVDQELAWLRATSRTRRLRRGIGDFFNAF